MTSIRMQMKIRKGIASFLAVLLFSSIIPLPTDAASVGDLSYTISNEEVTITDCNITASGKMVIPDTIEGYPVTKIGNYAFYDCSALTSVTIPASITSIGTLAFYNCENLKDVYITDLKAWCQINCDAFVSSPMCCATNLYLNGEKLTGELIIPSGVTRIGNGAFFKCYGITSVTIPSGVRVIGEYAFAFSNITNVSLPEGLKQIGGNAFCHCSLINVNIPASVSSIGEKVFDVSYSASPVVLTVNSAYARKYAEANGLEYILVLKSLNINQMPNKTEYCPNEHLDTSGMIISANYENGNSETVSSEDYAVRGFDLEKVGNNTIIVSYKGYEVTFDVNVRATHSYSDGENICDFCTYERVISSLEIKSLPQQTEYLLNEEFDFTGLVIKVNYSDGSSKEIDGGFEVNGFDSTKEGNCTISVVYDGAETTFDVTVEVMPLLGIAFASSNIQIAMGDAYQSEIIYTPSNATYKDVSWKSSDESIATVNEEGVISGVSKGTATIQATAANGITAECIVTVVNYKDISTNAEWLSISNRPTGMTYKLVADINVGSSVLNIPYSTNVLIDLNGHEVKGSGNIITNNGNLTIKDSSTGGKIYLYTESTNKICDLIKNYGTMKFIGGTLQIISSADNKSYAMVDIHGVNNYGTLEIEDGKIFVNTFIVSNSAGNFVNGIYNQSGGTVVMTGGEITVETTTETYLSGNKTYSYIYGIYNESINDLNISGAIINCINYCALYGYTNTIMVQGIQNYVAADITVRDAHIAVYVGGSAYDVTGGIGGLYNLSNGTIKVDSSKINVNAEIARDIAVSGINNARSGSIIVGSSLKSTIENMQITTSHTNNHDSVIGNVDMGHVIVQRGHLKGYTGIGNMNTGRVELGVNDGLVNSDVLIINTTGDILLSTSQIDIYDGKFIGNLDAAVPVAIPEGCSFSNSINNGVNEYVLVSDNWIKDSVGWWYRNPDGSYPYNCWKMIEGEWYYFNASGYRVTGWQSLGGSWYYMNADGAMLTGWQYIDNAWYYFNGSGAMVTGWQLIGGAWYYFHGSGAMASNQWIGCYYLQASGVMATNQWIGNYYVQSNGVYVSTLGWLLVGSNWYYLGAGGVRLTSQWIGSYYVKANGVMATNEWIGNYYVDSNGVYVSRSGWLAVGENWYYLGTGGVKLTNQWVDNYYYVGSEGVMATNQVIAGLYWVGNDGRWIPDYGADAYLRQLKTYITNYGWINSDGNDVISSSYNYNGTTYTAGIVYYSSTDELHFMFTSDNGNGTLSSVTMLTRTISSSVLYPDYKIVIGSYASHAIATLYPTTYTISSDLYFGLAATNGFTESQIQDSANSGLQLAFLKWSDLVEESGLTMKQIGFSAYIL